MRNCLASFQLYPQSLQVSASQQPSTRLEDTKTKGIAFLRENGNFKKFMLFDLLAFGFSSSAIIIHCLAAYLSASRATYPRQLACLLTFVSILSMTLAFWNGIIAVYGAKTRFTSMAMIICLSSSCIPIIYFLIRSFIALHIALYSRKTKILLHAIPVISAFAIGPTLTQQLHTRSCKHFIVSFKDSRVVHL